MGHSTRLLLALALPWLASPAPIAPMGAGVAIAPGTEPAAPRPVTIKLATLFPEGSVWDQSMRKMIADITKRTEGRVKVRVYPGGVAGDERDIIRKMRIGQLHAGSMTTSGLAELDDSFRVLEVPIFFDSDAEMEHVLRELKPVFRERLEKKGYVFLNWGHTGWVRFFATKPIRTVADLRSLKLFVWQGDTELEAWWKQNSFKPVPLAMTDVLTALQTGMIDLMPSTALASLSLQWFRQAPHMLEERLIAMVGATVVSKKTWDKLSAADREVVLEAANGMESFLFEVVPDQEGDAIDEMKKRGLSTYSLVADEDKRTWQALSEDFAVKMREGRMPLEVLEKAEAARAAYRQR